MEEPCQLGVSFAEPGWSRAGDRRLDQASKYRLHFVEMPMGNRDFDAAPAALHQQVQFESLLADISTRLLNLPPDAVDGEIMDALRRLGEHLDVDLGTIGTLNPVANIVQTSHSWARPGTAPVPLGLGETDLPWAAVELRAGRAVVFSRPEDLPETAAVDRETARRVGVQSVALLPLSAGGKLIGTVHFSTAGREVHWPDAIVQRLRLVGEIFASVLLRRETDLDLRRALEQVRALTERLEAENVYLRQDALDTALRGDLVGESNAMKRVLLRLEQVAPTDATVLILGETGVGKELVAKAIHQRSARREATLVRVNCAALPASLIESELFGHEKGAFTGAVARKLGRFELADGGTIFLDEIGELPLDLQAKLLRVLQDGGLERLGSHATTQVNVRVIAATNRDLKAAVAAGTFRSDLYYRLAVFPVEVPPLRQRSEDIPFLVRHFLAEFRNAAGNRVDVVPQTSLQRLLAYGWPGNIRELRNVIERAVILSTGATLMLDDAFEGIQPAAAVSEAGDTAALDRTLEEVERAYILAVLEACDWHIRGRGQAAERLGLHPSTLYSRMQKLGIQKA
jgi:transcriptional regulator with GAF, ATPase, and Fis domain